MKTKQPKKLICPWLCIFLVMAVFLSGCHAPGKPRARVGAFFGSPMGMPFPKLEKLGRHQFAPNPSEKNGMVYTCRAGFIDLGHLREAADRTAYLSDICYQNLLLEEEQFSYQVIEPSVYTASITYPENWSGLSVEEKQPILRETSIHMAQHFAYTSMIWHEIITWYGFASTGLFPENISSFSWEDTYSDLLGTTLAVKALADTDRSYDKAMTKLIRQILEELEIQPPAVGRQAAQAVAGDWFTGGMYFFVDMKKRNFDVGIDDQYVTPWLVPGICPDAKPRLLAAPSLCIPDSHGFTVFLEIEPVVMQKGKIYQALNKNNGEKIQPAGDFPVLLEQIKHQAVNQYGTDVDAPILEQYAFHDPANTRE